MIECGFFGAVNNDRTYNEDSFNEFFSGILSESGIYKKSGAGLQVSAGQGLSINVPTGKARICNIFVKVKSTENVELQVSDIANSRYDAIVLRYNKDEREITLQALAGIPSSSPQKPEITRNENIFDICLAYVYVAAGATSIDTDNITDTREDKAICGYVELQIDGINAGIKEYKNAFELTTEANQINVGIAEYDADNDVFMASINGIMLVENIDYTISGTGSMAKVNFTNMLDSGNMIEFKVLKAIVEVKE